jgi:UDP-2,3-diacylglucosamine hydrolase
LSLKKVFELPSQLEQGKKFYFASDFHLGSPNLPISLDREKRIISWINACKADAAAFFFVGDVFDFWFEYRRTIPKGHIRFQGKLAELADSGIPVYLFTGNHDLWMFGYFTRELGIPVFHEPIVLQVNGKKLMLGHGDGLGPGDVGYKRLKKIFKNPLCQWAFSWLHPDLGIKLANWWSGKSREKSPTGDQKFKGDAEWLWQYCKDTEAKQHHDYYIFGHRHLPLDLAVGENSRYINLGEWLKNDSYAVFDGNHVELKYYKFHSNTASAIE